MCPTRRSTRPDAVKILGKRISVSYVPAGDIGLKDSPEDENPGAGRNDPDKQQIFVEDNQPLDTEQDTVLHEIIHILEAYMGIRMSESAVTKLATGLIAVMKDNPRLLSYLKRKV